MKSPLWIVTSALGIVLIVLLCFIIYSMKTIFVQPPITSIKVGALPETDQKKEVQPADFSLIYEEHDLFGTYHPSIVSLKPVDTLPAIPPAPTPIPVGFKQKAPVQFLKPLPFKITGIIASTNEAKSQVSLMNTNTGKTDSYKMGDKVFDAYILRIFPTKIVILRSNGQQETLYMYTDEAKEDTTRIQDTTWSDTIARHSDIEYLLNPIAFSSRIASLAGLIDMLDLTTASKGGTALGLRIGKMNANSIGFACGFAPGDIITKIVGIEPTSSSARMKIFNEIVKSDLGTHIPVEYLREGIPFTTNFILFNLADPTATLEGIPFEPLIKQTSHKELPQTLPTKEQNKVTVAQVSSPKQSVIEPQVPLSISAEPKNRDLNAMKKYGGKSAVTEESMEPKA